jgi:glycosyltransferase involved in cell wall biosynthesis
VSTVHIFINCGPCENFVGKCIASVRKQSFRNWRAWVTADACGDATCDRAIEAAHGDARIHVQRNPKRLYSMANLVRSIERSQAAPEDILVCLDGDDWFYDRNALRTIVDTYEARDCWATYGSWVSNVPNLAGEYGGLWPAYPKGAVDFRRHRFLGTAVRTWKRWLWDRIRDEDLRSDSGRYVRVSEDQMIMIPLLEMCGTTKARHIAKPLMIYNKLQSYKPDRALQREGLKNGELIETREPYRRLKTKPKLVKR